MQSKPIHMTPAEETLPTSYEEISYVHLQSLTSDLKGNHFPDFCDSISQVPKWDKTNL